MNEKELEKHAKEAVARFQHLVAITDDFRTPPPGCNYLKTTFRIEELAWHLLGQHPDQDAVQTMLEVAEEFVGPESALIQPSEKPTARENYIEHTSNAYKEWCALLQVIIL